MSNDLFRRKAPVVMGWLLRDFALDIEDAAAILGNIGGETGGFKLMQEVKPVVAGSRGGYGWCQWTGPRRRAFERWCSEQKLAVDSDAANYGFLCHELRTSEKRALPALKQAEDVAAKVIAFERAFERAGIPHHDSRIRWAKIALDAYQDTNVPLPRPQPDIEPDAEPVEPDSPPAPRPQPDDPGPAEPAPAQPSLMRRISNWLVSLFTSGGLFYMDWRLGLVLVGVIVLGIGLALWLFGRERIKGFIVKHLGSAG